MLKKILAAFFKLNKKQLLALAAGAAALLGIIIIIICSVFNRLDVTKYIKVETADSFEGSGFAEISLDYVALAQKLEFKGFEDIRAFRDLEEEGLASLEQLIESEESLAEIEKEYELELGELFALGRAIEITAENNDGNLSNGDVVKITAKINKGAKFKKRLTGGKINYELHGLKSLFHVEPLIIPFFFGNSGSGQIMARASLDPSYGEWVNEIDFICSYSANETLSNGDVITITATVSDYENAAELAQQFGYGIKETTVVDITVVGLALAAPAE